MLMIIIDAAVLMFLLNVVNDDNIRAGTRPLLLNNQGNAVTWSDEQFAESA